MKKKTYEKATMKVVNVQCESHLLSASADAGVKVTLGSFVETDSWDN